MAIALGVAHRGDHHIGPLREPTRSMRKPRVALTSICVLRQHRLDYCVESPPRPGGSGVTAPYIRTIP
jgi:hypothetical protein